MTTGQLALFDFDEAADNPPAPEWSPPEIDGECRHCGTPISSRSPIDSVNHGTYGDTCVSRQLSRMHALNAQRQLDPEVRRDDYRCMKHQGKRKACTQECFEKEYESYAARATDSWGGDGWREEPA